jgi:lipopolysaccharide/colanic/teichoic acid biosynthesis glycosyltransferase
MLARLVASYLVALPLALLLLPAIAALALLVRAADGAPAFYRARRVGRGGREFRMYKLRTMRAAPGPLITTAYDPRITRLGGRLRRWRLDELPQLLNVLRGEMALVGPRPESPDYAAQYGAQRADMLALWPGITDPGTLAFLFLETEIVSQAADPAEAYVRHVMPARNRLSIAYARVATPLQDLAVLAQTVAALLSRRSADRIGAHCLRRFPHNELP